MKKKIALLILLALLIAPHVNIKAMAGEYKPEPSAEVALNILKYAAKINDIDSNNLYWLDQDYDGIVSSEDALIVLKKAVKLDTPIVFSNKIDAISENAEKLEVSMSDIIEIPNQEDEGMYLLRTAADYSAFMRSVKELAENMHFDCDFDNGFFENKSLIVVVTTKGSDDSTLHINDVYKEGNVLQISYTITQPEIPQLGLTGHMIFIALEDSDIQGVNDLAEHVTWK